MNELPTRKDKLKAQIAELDANIEQGLEFERLGFGNGLMISLTESMRDKLAAELAALEVSHE